MTGGVREYQIAVLRWLDIGSHCAESYGLDFRLHQIIDGQIEVHLFGDVPIGPRGLSIVLDPDGREPDSICLDGDEIITGERDFTLKELCPELSKCSWVGTVQSNGTQTNSCHWRNGSATEAPGPT